MENKNNKFFKSKVFSHDGQISEGPTLTLDEVYESIEYELKKKDENEKEFVKFNNLTVKITYGLF